MRIKVDRGLCTGHGRCYALAPDVVDADDDGYGVVRSEQVPVAQEAAARRAAANCPEDAISISD